MTQEIKQEITQENKTQDVKQDLPVTEQKPNTNSQKKIIIVSVLGLVAAIAIGAMIFCLIKL